MTSKFDAFFDEDRIPSGLSRRGFLKRLGGGVTIAITIGGYSTIQGCAESDAGEKQDFNAYLKIKEDGRVDCMVGKIGPSPASVHDSSCISLEPSVDKDSRLYCSVSIYCLFDLIHGRYNPVSGNKSPSIDCIREWTGVYTWSISSSVGEAGFHHCARINEHIIRPESAVASPSPCVTGDQMLFGQIQFNSIFF